MTNLEKVKESLLERENSLSIYATKSKDAIRLRERKEDIRPSFFHDIDTIIHSSSYTRYIGKTQVFSYFDNDNISKRMIHVQLVSKIARTIGRSLNLNEDLIEAIGLGHDIGHTPLGHTGEHILNKISMKELNRPFMHNIQSVRTFMYLTNEGKGDNLSIQVLDGIMCHNGEKLEKEYEPVTKTKEEFLKDFEESTKNSEYAKNIKPMTLEGCIVRISDVIAYLGRDIEDAIMLNRLTRDEIPKEITNVLGTNNSEIINTIVLDIIENSYGKSKIILSDNIYNAMSKLIEFNYKNIYYRANSKQDLEYYEERINKLYYALLDDLNNKKEKSIIYKIFLFDKKDYYNNTDKKQIVIDFLAGMTDDYFMKLSNEYC